VDGAAAGRVFSSALIVYPDTLAALEGFDELPFNPADVTAVFQTTADLQKRSTSDWTYFTNDEKTV